MDSSDSDDDCYGNLAKKLQSMKKKYAEDKFDCTQLLDNTINKVTKKKKPAEFTTPAVEDSDTVEILDDTGEMTLDSIIAANSNKRVTRSSKRNLSAISVDSILPEHATRRRKNNSESIDSIISIVDSPVPTDVTSTRAPTNSSGRGARARSRGSKSNRRGRGRGRGRRATTNIPTISIGNTDYYPDPCDNQELFMKQSDVIDIDEQDPDIDTENEELSVKVYWQNLEHFTFTIRRYQKFTQIYQYFCQKANVSYDKLLFTYNDKVLNIDDTPDSISYNIAKFIDGGITKRSVTELSKKSDNKDMVNGIKIKFQCQNIKKPFVTLVQSDDKLSLAMMKCSEHLEVPYEKLKFFFDGDLISAKSTPRDLELEGGECIDVKILS